MGRGMAANLAQAGLLSTVWNRTPARAAEFAAAHPVTIAGDPADLAQQVDVVLTCVSADEDLRAVVDAMMPGLGSGKIIIDTSTVGADTVEAIAAVVAEEGVDFLDAPVTGGAEGAEAGTLQVMVGGERDALARVEPVFQCDWLRIHPFRPDWFRSAGQGRQSGAGRRHGSGHQ